MRHESDWWLGGFLIGFLIGGVLGFTYTRLVPYTPYITPGQLSHEDREVYLVLIAAAYRFDSDLDKAQRRLKALGDPLIEQTIIELGDGYIEEQADIRDIRSLAYLAAGLNLANPSLTAFLPTDTPTPTVIVPPTAIPTVTATPTQMPTSTATKTATPTVRFTSVVTITQPTNPTITPRFTSTPGANAAFGLAQSVALCDNTADGVLRVYVRNRFGQGVPGIEVKVRWTGSEDTFFTGIKSDVNPGYADFQMENGQTYQIELPGLKSAIATEINQAAADRCPNMPPDLSPSWQVVFQQGAGQ